MIRYPVAVWPRRERALIPSLTSYREEIRDVTVLGRARTIQVRLQLEMRLVRVHVDGEDEPRDIAEERLLGCTDPGDE